MTKPLGSGSIAVYDAIEEFYSLNGRSPGYEEIMAKTEFTSKATIGHHPNRLEQAGWIIREHKLQHAIVPVRYPRTYYRIRKLAADFPLGWVYAPADHADTCPDCETSLTHARAQPNIHGLTSADTNPKRNS